MAGLVLDRLCKAYGDSAAVADVSLRIEDGEFLVLLGPSGCGKTTTLRMIAGFVAPDSGSVAIGGRDMTQVRPWARNCGLVFQSYALFPHMSVEQNVGFGLDMRKITGNARRQRIDEALRMVRLGGLGERLPRQLSGGQQQRVALARALAMQPDVLLLDEPMSNLDARLRQDVRIEIRELQRELRLTTIMVTHDQDEALIMADRLAVMDRGRVRQVGSQRELYETPADRFVAGFIGQSSFIEGEVTAPGRFRSAGGLAIACPASTVTGSASLALRPERINIGPEADGLINSFTGKVAFASYLGSGSDLHIALEGGDRLIARLINRDGRPSPREGDTIRVGWPEDAARVYPDVTSGRE